MINSQRASSSTSFLFNAGKDGKSKVSRLLVTGNFAAYAALGGPLFTVEQFQLAELLHPRIQALGGALPRQFVVLEEGWQPQRFQMRFEDSIAPQTRAFGPCGRAERNLSAIPAALTRLSA